MAEPAVALSPSPLADVPLKDSSWTPADRCSPKRWTGAPSQNRSAPTPTATSAVLWEYPNLAIALGDRSIPPPSKPRSPRHCCAPTGSARDPRPTGRAEERTIDSAAWPSNGRSHTPHNFNRFRPRAAKRSPASRSPRDHGLSPPGWDPGATGAGVVEGTHRPAPAPSRPGPDGRRRRHELVLAPAGKSPQESRLGVSGIEPPSPNVCRPSRSYSVSTGAVLLSL